MILAHPKSPNFKEHTRVKVNVHVARRGLLLVEVCKVFGDTWESVDEVNCPRFLFVYIQTICITKTIMIMKKQLLLLVMMALPMVAMADAVEIDGIYYNLNTDEKVAEVTSNPNKYMGGITIPETITYQDIVYSVTTIGASAFKDCSDLTSIYLPNNINRIKSYAFQNCI